jgi:hypothetical protein
LTWIRAALSSLLLITYVNGMKVANLRHQRRACERAAISPVSHSLTRAAPEKGWKAAKDSMDKYVYSRSNPTPEVE